MKSTKINDSCTTILVGKKATYDGSTMIVRSCDDPAGQFTPKRFEVVKPENQGAKYKAVISGCEVEIPPNPQQYTRLPTSIRTNGIWGSAGVNSKNIGMSATETITSNALVQGADPLVDNGLGEEDYLVITLPYINSAKEGCKRLGELVEKHGTYEMNGIAFSDDKEIWWKFIEMVEAEYELITKFKDYNFKFEVVSGNGANNNVRAIQDPNTKVVTYKVTISNGTETETITLASALNGIYTK